jgi:zinc transport system permease protein
MTGIFSYTFMQNALAVSLLTSVAAGVVGTLVKVNRMSALAGSIAHASFGGLGLAYALGFSPVLGAMGFAVLSSLGIAAVSSRRMERAGTAMAAVWATGMATGLILIKISGTYAPDLMSWLFGSLLAVSMDDILFAIVLDVVVLTIIIAYYKEFLAVSYDMQFSRLQGLSVNGYRILFLVMTALTAVLLMRVTGLIMVIAMLSIPPAIAQLYTKSLWKMMLLACLLTAVFNLTGLFTATLLDLPPGAVIILISAACYTAALLVERIRSG